MEIRAVDTSWGIASADLAACLDCSTGLRGLAFCPACGRPYPIESGILRAIGPLRGSNRVAAAFYDGPHWRRFRPLERLFLRFQGGQVGARLAILKHLPSRTNRRPRVLEIGIGDGENLPILPRSWEIHGVDISRVQLAACLRRFPRMAGRLSWAEAEALPFPSATFDAVFSIGGFNYFRDPARAIQEARRVARPGATVVIADEIPSLRIFSMGHLLGFPHLDRWFLQALGLDREFAAMVLDLRLDLETLRQNEWPEARHHRIWHRLGYCLVGPASSQGEHFSGDPSR